MAHQTDGDATFSELTHVNDQNLLYHHTLPDTETSAALSGHSAPEWNAPYPQKRPVSFHAVPQASPFSQSTILEPDASGLKQNQDPPGAGPKINNEESPKRGRGRPRKHSQEPSKVQAARQSERLRINSQTEKQQQRKRRNEWRSDQEDLADEATGRGPHAVSLALPASQESDHGTLDKKELLRSRNRRAAEKCHLRKQRSIERLQDKAAANENIHGNLTNEAASLREEILMLKSMLLVHSHCGEPSISSYLEKAASDIASGHQKFVSGSDSCDGPALELPDSLLTALNTEFIGATTNHEDASMAGWHEVNAVGLKATAPHKLEAECYSHYPDPSSLFANAGLLEEEAPVQTIVLATTGSRR